jgi:Type II secretion system (T2SS), protein E, N-terminal domain
MLARGELNHEQLRKALEEQKQHGCGRIGEWIQRLGYAQEPQITAALGVQWSCPVLPALPASIADCAIPVELLRRFKMVPIHYSRRMSVMHMAFASCIDYRALLAIEQMLECKAQPCLASASAVQSYLARLDEEGNRGNLSFGDVGGPDQMIRIISSYAVKLVAEAVRLVGCAEYVWVKIEGTKEAVNLIFEHPSAEAALDYRIAKVP